MELLASLRGAVFSFVFFDHMAGKTVTAMRAPNTSASFAGPMTESVVSRLCGAQSTI
jgi:hypothetical protein